jgi:FkbM family methyltransferase
MTADWREDRLFFSAEERLKHFILPDKLYLRFLAKRRLRKGEKELHILPFIVPRGGTSIDIGANKGLYAWLLSRLSDRVQAFEPNPKIYALLKHAVPANVETHEVALSNKNGEADLILPIHRTGRYSNQGATLQTRKLGPDGDFGLVKVTQKRLDDYGFTDVGFVKIDVEGYELEVLEGAREMLERERPVLLIEIEEGQNKRPLDEAIATVKGYGYDCFYVSTTSLRHYSQFATDTEKTPTNNFIFLPVHG